MSTTPAPPDAPPPNVRPLLVTDDGTLLDQLLQLTAAADVQASVAHTPSHALHTPETPLVVVGTDLAPSLVLPDRHPNLVLARRSETAGSPPDEIWQQAVRLGAHNVYTLPADNEELTEIIAEAVEGRAPAAPVVGVMAGRGGAGASLLAVALAMAGTRAGLRTLLIDVDPVGGGLDLVLGEEHASGARWGELTERQGRISPKALWNALPHVHGMALLTWSHDATTPIPAQAMRSILGAATRGTELVVADLPRSCAPATEEVLRQAGSVFVVIPADVRSTIAASRLARDLRGRTTRLRAVVRSRPTGGLDADVVAGSAGIPLAGELTPEPGLERLLDRGDVPASRARSPLRTLATQLVAELSPAGVSS
ncbi:CpaE-like family protein [Lipingzhangella sp. LS1_29]|uniref:CpaE-like family protein n=1 Tax=Lipingzhangella rawalii TaxID=2055835 RepID=A0ABU2H3Z3_9ACTN|nr:septum site-determining protein Ssd [Lipingzhangella rawalii]MDS1270023.1 CpaE-like family protein [Lipingzhangella rawalii]